MFSIQGSQIDLDAAYPKIVPKSWFALVSNEAAVDRSGLQGTVRALRCGQGRLSLAHRFRPQRESDPDRAGHRASTSTRSATASARTSFSRNPKRFRWRRGGSTSRCTARRSPWAGLPKASSPGQPVAVTRQARPHPVAQGRERRDARARRRRHGDHRGRRFPPAGRDAGGEGRAEVLSRCRRFSSRS